MCMEVNRNELPKHINVSTYIYYFINNLVLYKELINSSVIGVFSLTIYTYSIKSAVTNLEIAIIIGF